MPFKNGPKFSIAAPAALFTDFSKKLRRFISVLPRRYAAVSLKRLCVEIVSLSTFVSSSVRTSVTGGEICHENQSRPPVLEGRLLTNRGETSQCCPVPRIRSVARSPQAGIVRTESRRRRRAASRYLPR